jgi:DNA-binding transcriptional LysR family regulator
MRLAAARRLVLLAADNLDGVAELETREIEYFVAVAEELHFRRAAERLHIAQPALSKAIGRLESRLGVRLLDRDSKSVSLTAAGEALLSHGRQVLSAVSLAGRSARQARRPDARLRLVMKPGGDANLLPAIMAVYAREPGAREVDVLFGGVSDRVEFLRDGRADAALLYTPLDDLTGLRHVTLLTEERFAVLPREHRLARRRKLRLADLDGEIMPRWQGLGQAGEGPEVADMSQLTHLIVLGRAIALLPPSALGPANPDLVRVPVIDAPPSSLVLAWAGASSSAAVEAFARCAVAAAGAGGGRRVAVVGTGPPASAA